MLPFDFLSPFKGDFEKWINKYNYGEGIQNYVQEMITKSMESSMQNNILKESMGIFEQKEERQNQLLNMSTFESHDHVYVKVFIKDESQLSNLKIFYTTNQFIVEGIPHSDDRHVVPLPSIVKMKGAISEYRDNYLQIKIPKKIDLQYTEIDVQSTE